ncbi:MAG: DUF255 domain-containing protein [Panacagrimonas sp.]
MNALRLSLLVPVLVLCLAFHLPSSAKTQDGIQWRAWNAESFALAKAQNKPVFLYLEAVWCHWCHVMQDQTFSKVEVQKRLARDFIVVRVDHDAAPGLANRYRDYGWPALVFLSADGKDLVKRAGYIEPEGFANLLDAIVRDPTPERASLVSAPPVGPSQLATVDRAYLLKQHDASFDSRLGGLLTSQKFIDRDSVEYALVHASQPAERRKAELTLTSALTLMDPVWGGASQYSTGGVWGNAHFEKIMRTQAAYLRIYALAYGHFGRAADLKAAQDIQRYLVGFLRSPDTGAFYVSQDADVVPGQYSKEYFDLDDAGRRKLGVPRIDKNLYADANGAAAEALATLYGVSGDQTALDAAVRATDWALANRKGSRGLMRHGEPAETAPHLSDSLAIGRASLALYEATGERRWLKTAVDLGAAMEATLRASGAGFLTEAASPSLPVQPMPDLAENIFATRFFNRLAHYSGNKDFREAALHGMKYLVGHASRQQDIEEAGILLADDELARDPVHLTVVGAKTDTAARALFATALKTPGSYRRVEWLDRAEGPLPNSDVTYPEFAKSAAYVCTAGRCSRPSYESADYAKQIARLTAAVTASVAREAM